MLGDVQYDLEPCHEAFKHMPDDETFARSPIALNLGLAYAMRGEMNAASRCLNEAITLAEATGNPYIALIAMGCLAEIQARQGFLHQAAETNRHALRLGARWSDSGEPLSATSYAHISLAEILYQWNELDEASRHLTRGIQLSEQCGSALIVRFFYPGLALMSEFQGKTNSAPQPGDFASGIVNAPYDALLSKMIAAWQARLSLAHGDLKAVERWAASQQLDLRVQKAPDFWQEFPYLTLIRLRIAQGRVEEVSEMLENLLQKAESESRLCSVIEILVLQSIALKMQGKTDQAVATLGRALSLAEPEGYIRMFVDEGNSMKELLGSAASRGIAMTYVNRLLGAFAGSERHPEEQPADVDEEAPPAIPSITGPVKPTETLSARELEILKYMATGATSKEIARELFLSVGTVKKHIISIYRKLDVHKQTTAVTKAQELGLL